MESFHSPRDEKILNGVTNNKYTIAVVGSGLAGLTAAYLLSKKYKVTLFERHPSLGMDAHSIDIQHEGKIARADVPLRVIYPGYYKTLMKLYSELEIKTEKVSYAASFSNINEDSYFQYKNFRMGRFSIPYVKSRYMIKSESRRILSDIFRLFRSINPRANSFENNITIQEYLSNNNFSKSFSEGFLYPTFAAICTCTLEAVKEYPAEVILNYLNQGLLFRGVKRVTNGSKEVVKKLSKNVSQVRLSAKIISINKDGEKLSILEENGNKTFYDHIILGIPANKVSDILAEEFSIENEILNSFRYENSTVLMHSDNRLAPSNRTSWSPVNLISSSRENTPMATIWMNKVQPLLSGTSPIFQTWNPILEPRENLVISKAEFERPIVDKQAIENVEKIKNLHLQDNRRIWFCGSYAEYAVPLLESACSSAVSVSRRLGCKLE